MDFKKIALSLVVAFSVSSLSAQAQSQCSKKCDKAPNEQVEKQGKACDKQAGGCCKDQAKACDKQGKACDKAGKACDKQGKACDKAKKDCKKAQAGSCCKKQAQPKKK